MAIMAPAPDHAFMGLMRALSHPADDYLGLVSTSTHDLEYHNTSSTLEPNVHYTPAAAWHTQFLAQQAIPGAVALGMGATPKQCSTAWGSCANTPSLGSHRIMEDARIREVMLGIRAGNGSGSSVVSFAQRAAQISSCFDGGSGSGGGEKYIRVSCDHGLGVGVSKSSLPAMSGPGSGAPQLEAVEGVTEASAAVDGVRVTPHVEARAEVAKVTQQEKPNPSNSSCSAGAGSPARSLSVSPSLDTSASHRAKRKKLLPDQLPSPTALPKGGEGESSSKANKRCKGDGEDTRKSSETSAESGQQHKERERERERMQRTKVEYSKQDYIHVRARRGQATDSHSLAERVRREKISERMKFLQDLVPGCRKLTGKAVMLDEIINYVQSLQRQVEHLSMKLASVGPAGPAGRPNMLESLVSNKELLQAQLSTILGSTSSSEANAFGSSSLQPATASLHLGRGHCGSVGHFGISALQGNGSSLDHVSSRSNLGPNSLSSQLAIADMTPLLRSFDSSASVSVCQSSGWDGELQSVVQMGLSHPGRLGAFEGQLHRHMKVEF